MDLVRELQTRGVDSPSFNVDVDPRVQSKDEGGVGSVEDEVAAGEQDFARG